VPPAQDAVGEVTGGRRAPRETDDVDVEPKGRAGTDGGAGIEVVGETVADIGVEALELQVDPGLQLEGERATRDDVVAHAAGRAHALHVEARLAEIGRASWRERR